MSDLPETFDGSAAVAIRIDADSGEIIDCRGAVADLLRCEARELAGRHWQAALGVAGPGGRIVDLALQAGTGTALPPLLLGSDGGALVAGGVLLPRKQPGCAPFTLLLWPLAAADSPWLAGTATGSDAVAVLGVDGLAYDEHFGYAETARLMMDIRAGLLQIVRAQDTVGLPAGASISIILRDVSSEQAVDMSRALLSHLRAVLADREDGAAHARAGIGLAHLQGGQDLLSGMVAANDALLARTGDPGEEIHLAEAGDFRQIVARVVNADGVFSGNRPDPGQHGYLAELTALMVEGGRVEAYLQQVFELTLQQPGVAAIGLWRRGFDGSYSFLAARAAEGDGTVPLPESKWPRAFREGPRRLEKGRLEEGDELQWASGNTALIPLRASHGFPGCLIIGYTASGETGRFVPDLYATHYLATVLAGLKEWRGAEEKTYPEQSPEARALETGIEGYVSDNMEGAIDQAVFLATVDVPVAIVGPRGTGKMYVARIIHQEAGGAPGDLVTIDCREFRSRGAAITRIGRELQHSSGRTLVFKSPHLMHADAQVKLARQISTRVLADVTPPRYLTGVRFVALFPDRIEHLVRQGTLQEKLAGVFAGYPIRVPPLRDRRRAVLRWAHKILGQECARRDRRIIGFTPDAEQALLQHDWPGNISEMRQAIVSALDKTDKEWVTPVDLGIFKGISARGAPAAPAARPFLAPPDEESEAQAYTPAAEEALKVALGEALHTMLELEQIRPLGTWLDDEVILAACERYREDVRGAADFLHTRPRNISRWMPKVLDREPERGASLLWQESRRLVRQWISESAPLPQPPQRIAQQTLLRHVIEQCAEVGAADRARIMGVSVPTYQKRLQELQERS
ncbi:MAG: sigma 54-interacting transcriptional regulator [Halioglobus sp.]